MARRKRRTGPVEECPCGTGQRYEQCCGPLHTGSRQAVEAVEVMRARYSAHVVGDHRYLLETWHPDTRPAGIAGGSERWLRLEVGEVTRGGALDGEGSVAFAAHFRTGDRSRALRETSRFVRLAGRWVYYDGELDF